MRIKKIGNIFKKSFWINVVEKIRSIPIVVLGKVKEVPNHLSVLFEKGIDSFYYFIENYDEILLKNKRDVFFYTFLFLLLVGAFIITIDIIVFISRILLFLLITAFILLSIRKFYQHGILFERYRPKLKNFETRVIRLSLLKHSVIVAFLLWNGFLIYAILWPMVALIELAEKKYK